MPIRKKGFKYIKDKYDESLYRFVYLKYDPQEVYKISLHGDVGITLLAGNLLLVIHPPPDSQKQPKEKGTSTATELKVPFAGKIQQISQYFLKSQQKKGEATTYLMKHQKKQTTLELFKFKICEHQPNSQIKHVLIEGQLTQEPKPLYKSCQFCGTTISAYFQQESIRISLKQFLAHNCHLRWDELDEIEWSVLLNQLFTKNTSIAKVDQKEISIPFTAKATFLINFQEYGHKKLKEMTVIMIIKKLVCQHEKIVESKCQHCLEKITAEQGNSVPIYAFQADHPNSVIVKGGSLFLEEENFMKDLVQKGKGILVLDLDNTILHSVQLHELDFETFMDLQEYYILKKLEIPNNFNIIHGECVKNGNILVKMRPYFKEFIYEASKVFEIFVYTKGTRPYAVEICKNIRAQFANEMNEDIVKVWEEQKYHFLKEQAVSFKKIVSRDEDQDLDKKSITKILPTRKDHHVILDDRRDVWENSPAWIFTKDFLYFSKVQISENKEIQIEKFIKEINTEQESKRILKIEKAQKKLKLLNIDEGYFNMIGKTYKIEANKKKDYFLLFAAQTMRTVHRRFNEIQQDPNSENKPIYHILQKYRYSFFQKLNIKFLWDNENAISYKRALKLGARIVKQEPKDETCIIIRPSGLFDDPEEPEAKTEQFITKHENKKKIVEGMVEKMKFYSQKNFKIITDFWISLCYEYTYPFKHEKFVLKNPFEHEADRFYEKIVEEKAGHIKLEVDQRMKESMERELITEN